MLSPKPQDSNRVKYVTIQHSPAFTAQEIAASAHIPGQELAKTVMVKVDGKMAMAVLSANKRIHLELLEAAAGATTATLATEHDFTSMFPDCEVGAMPPFGNLFGIPVVVDRALLEDEEIAFNAGSHSELIRLSYQDFERLAQPTLATFSIRP